MRQITDVQYNAISINKIRFEMSKVPPNPRNKAFPPIITEVVVKVAIETENGRKVQKCIVGKYFYRTEDLLGQGFSSKVYKCTLIDNKKERFAIKVIDLSKFQSHQLFLLDSEIEIMCSLNHPNIVRCVEVYKNQQNYYLITQYCPHGDLSDLIKLQKCITEDKAVEIMKQIIQGYKYLMSKNIIHRDLKPANIMRFTHEWKIGDFGFAKFCKQDYLLQKMYVGTPLYMPPEALQINKYSVKSDIFALGIIFYEMIAGETPWLNTNEKQLVQNMINVKAKIPQWIMTQEVKYFITKAVETNFYERMSKEQLKNFTLQNVDINKIVKTRPGRGVSPALQRQLAKSGKKSVMYTQLKSTPLIQLQTSTNQINNGNFQKQNRLKLDLSLNNNIKNTDDKSFKSNCEIIFNQIQLSKIIMEIYKSCDILNLQRQHTEFFKVFLCKTAIKLLKLLCSIRTNTYRFQRWDVFKFSDELKISLSQANKQCLAFEQLQKILIKNVSQLTIFNYDKQFSLFKIISVSHCSFFRKLCERLIKFLNENLLSKSISISQSNTSQYCQLLININYILACFRMRTNRQNEIEGFGIKIKRASFNKIYDSEDLRNCLKDLQFQCINPINAQ